MENRQLHLAKQFNGPLSLTFLMICFTMNTTLASPVRPFQVERNKCYDFKTNTYFVKGTSIPHGECSVLMCENTYINGLSRRSLTLQTTRGCKPLYFKEPHCNLVGMNNTLPYPQCCPHYDCAKDEHGKLKNDTKGFRMNQKGAAELEEDPTEPQCYLREANKYYKKGSYPHPTECAIFTCDVIVGSDGKKKAEYIAFTCVEYDMDMIASGQCELMQSGVKDKPYPDCCNVYTCSDKDYK